MNPPQLLDTLIGHWTGTCRTWFQPDQLADESAIQGEFTKVLEGRFIRHTYNGQMKGKPRSGEELIAFNAVSRRFQTTWVDDFHMNYAIMVSESEPVDEKQDDEESHPVSFTVMGYYDVAPDQPRWGWKTVYEYLDDGHLRMTAYNVDPAGTEAKAVETLYERIEGHPPATDT